MKKLLLNGLLLCGLSSFGQTICKNVNEFNNQISYNVDKNFILMEGTKGLSITPYLKEYKGKIIFTELMVKVIGIGCVETGSTLIIIFENGEKETFTGWNKFNCDGNSFMSLTVKGDNLLVTQKISKIQFTNASNQKTITGSATVTNKNYFIDVNGNLNLGNDSSFKNCKK